MTTDQFDFLTKQSWQTIQRPAEVVENRLILAILNHTFPVNANLPGERELSEALGVTRPTLREALQRLQRDGWIEIHQGKPTRVCDFWKEGKLGVLDTLASHVDRLPQNFVPNLLKVRLAIAPPYTALAVLNAPQNVVQLLGTRHQLDQSSLQYAQFDWSLQHGLTVLSENPVFVLILNGFEDLFLTLAPAYFQIPEARDHSFTYYEALAHAAENKDAAQAKSLTEKIMEESLQFWSQLQF